jgi:CubicO group peptidase (beta-lactamase class C family)
MSTDGSNQRKLTDFGAVDWFPAWSPDGSRIAFVSNRDGNDEIYSMNADGSDARRLTQTADADESFPAWSPDGSHISFDSNRGGNWDVYVMASDGSDVRRLTNHPGEDWISSWSPDGQRIVFESKRDGNYEIYVMNADGSGQQRLTRNAVQDGDPSWSPDGSRIVFRFSGAVLIALDGKPIWQEAYGMADRTREIPNQIDTKFNLGSMDKMFTAVAIMQLVEQDRLSVDDKIADVLPDYPNRQVAEAVTIHQLLTHTSGMGDWSESELFPDLHDQIRGVEDYLPLFVDTPLEFEPGDHFGYSNSGYIVLGLIIERITGQSYYDYVRASIFEPSGMIHTAAYMLDEDVPNLAIGYTRYDANGNETDEIRDNSSVMPMRGGPAGGGYSTVEDLLRFRNALLDHQLLSPESTELLLQGKVTLDDQVQYAYGFFDRIVENQRVVGHGGGAPGICDFMDIYLDRGYTFVVLTNSDSDCLAAREAIKKAMVP